MQISTPTFALAMVVLVCSAGTLGWLVHSRRVHRAFGYWSCALWLNALALGLMALSVGGAVAGVTLLLLPWPALTLAGLRRFDARIALPIRASIDLLACAVAALLSLAVSLLAPALGWPHLALLAGLSLYACVVSWPRADAAQPGVSRALAAPWLVMALVSTLAALAWPSAGWASLGLVATLVVGSVSMTFAAQLLSAQRTERQLRLSRRRLQVLANTDMLTQVPNRRHFEELATRALQSESADNATLVLLDIDHFKQINDKLGHAAGDRALRLVSRSALDLLRDHDVAGRHGGDEFALLLKDTSTDEAMFVAQRLVAHIQTRSRAQALPRLSLSFGMVQLRRGEAIDDALRRADLALYEAKRLGRSRAVSADGDESEPEFHSSQRLGLGPS